MAYSVKSCFLTLQGEGAKCGTVAVFCRFVGCNLWSGLENQRSEAVCQFCDTDFRKPYAEGGGSFEDPQELAAHIASFWPTEAKEHRTVVFTGGEPLLQLDAPLIEACHERDFQIAVETNGTINAPSGIDWICVSPKANAKLIQTSGHELKLVYPQGGLCPTQFEDLDFDHFFLQPMDSVARDRNTQLAVSFCQQNPKWRLSVQTHKWIGIP